MRWRRDCSSAKQGENEMRTFLIAVATATSISLLGTSNTSAEPARGSVIRDATTTTSIVQDAYCRVWRRCWHGYWSGRRCRVWRRCW